MFSVPGLLLPVIAFELVHLDEEVVRRRVLLHRGRGRRGVEDVWRDRHLLAHSPIQGNVAEGFSGQGIEPRRSKCQIVFVYDTIQFTKNTKTKRWLCWQISFSFCKYLRMRGCIKIIKQLLLKPTLF